MHTRAAFLFACLLGAHSLQSMDSNHQPPSLLKSSEEFQNGERPYLPLSPHNDARSWYQKMYYLGDVYKAALDYYLPKPLIPLVCDYLRYPYTESEIIPMPLNEHSTGLTRTPGGELCSWRCIEDKAGHALRIALLTAAAQPPEVARVSGYPPYAKSFIYGKLFGFSLDRQQRLFVAKAEAPHFTQILDKEHAAIPCFAVSADERIIAIPQDMTIYCYNTTTYYCICTLTGHSAPIVALFFHPTHHAFLFSGAQDGTIKKWHISQQDCVKTFKWHTQAIRQITATLKGLHYASSSKDRNVCVWKDDTQERKSEKPLHTLPHQDKIQEIALCGSGRLAVLTGQAGAQQITFWSDIFKKGIPNCTLLPFPATERFVCVERDGIRSSMPLNSGITISDLGFSANGDFGCKAAPLGGPSQGHNFVLYPFFTAPEEASQRHLHKPTRNSKLRRPVFHAASLPSKAFLVQNLHVHFPKDVANFIATFILCELGVPVRGFDFSKELAPGPAEELCIYQSPEDKDGEAALSIMQLSSYDKPVRTTTFLNSPPFIDYWIHSAKYSFILTQQGELFAASHDQEPRSFSRVFSRYLPIRCFTISALQNLIAIARKKRIFCHTIGAKEKRKYVLKHTAPVSALCFHPSKPELLSGGEDGTLKKWNLTTQQCEQTLSGHTKSILNFSFKRDGTVCASSSLDNTVRVWNYEKGTLDNILSHPEPLQAVSFCPDGYLATTTERDTFLWMGFGPSQKPYCMGLHVSKFARVVDIYPTSDKNPVVLKKYNAFFLPSGHFCYQLNAQRMPSNITGPVTRISYGPLPSVEPLQNPLAHSAQEKPLE